MFNFRGANTINSAISKHGSSANQKKWGNNNRDASQVTTNRIINNNPSLTSSNKKKWINGVRDNSQIMRNRIADNYTAVVVSNLATDNMISVDG